MLDSDARTSAGRTRVVFNRAIPEKSRIVSSDRLIHAERILLLVLVKRGGIDGVIVPIQLRAGLRQRCFGVGQPRRIKETNGNLIIWKWISNKAARMGRILPGSERVINLRGNVAQVPVIVGFGGYPEKRIRRPAIQKLLKGSVEERPVLS